MARDAVLFAIAFAAKSRKTAPPIFSDRVITRAVPTYTASCLTAGFAVAKKWPTAKQLHWRRIVGSGGVTQETKVDVFRSWGPANGEYQQSEYIKGLSSLHQPSYRYDVNIFFVQLYTQFLSVIVDNIPTINNTFDPFMNRMGDDLNRRTIV